MYVGRHAFRQARALWPAMARSLCHRLWGAVFLLSIYAEVAQVDADVGLLQPSRPVGQHIGTRPSPRQTRVHSAIQARFNELSVIFCDYCLPHFQFYETCMAKWPMWQCQSTSEVRRSSQSASKRLRSHHSIPRGSTVTSFLSDTRRLSQSRPYYFLSLVFFHGAALA